jgi:hypothetical protein
LPLGLYGADLKTFVAKLVADIETLSRVIGNIQ